jgi:hypothetical protein
MCLLQPENNGGSIKNDSDGDAQEIRKWPQCMGRFVQYLPVTVTSGRNKRIKHFKSDRHTYKVAPNKMFKKEAIQTMCGQSAKLGFRT